MRTELARTLSWEWLDTKRTQRDLAPHVGIRQNVLSTYISGTRYPDDAGLRALCTRWPDPRAGIRILLAHLQDRINTAGRPGEITVSPVDKEARPVRAEVEADIATLRAEAYRQNYADVRRLLHDLAELIRNSQAVATTSTMAAAEAPAEYKTKAKMKRS